MNKIDLNTKEKKGFDGTIKHICLADLYFSNVKSLFKTFGGIK